jgi:hypothetical protein
MKHFFAVVLAVACADALERRPQLAAALTTARTAKCAVLVFEA